MNKKINLLYNYLLKIRNLYVCIKIVLSTLILAIQYKILTPVTILLSIFNYGHGCTKLFYNFLGICERFRSTRMVYFRDSTLFCYDLKT